MNSNSVEATLRGSAHFGYIERRVGSEFDPDVAHAFIRMLRECEPRAAAARALESEKVAESAAVLDL